VPSYPPLSERLLELEQRWRLAGSPIVPHLAPGVTREVVVAALEPLGLVPTGELLTWFGWHNGRLASARAAGPRAERAGPGIWRLLDLEEAVARYRLSRDVAERAAEEWFTAEQIFPRHWFPIMDEVGGASLLLRTYGEVRERSEVSVSNEDGFDDAPPVGSLAEAVGVWLETMDSGLAYAVEGMWVRDWQRWPVALRQLPIW